MGFCSCFKQLKPHLFRSLTCLRIGCFSLFRVALLYIEFFFASLYYFILIFFALLSS